MKSIGLLVFVAICSVSLLVRPSSGHPLHNQLTDKERQEISHAAARIMRIALGENEMLAGKRNAGTLDAILGMPDLLDVGRK